MEYVHCLLSVVTKCGVSLDSTWSSDQKLGRQGIGGMVSEFQVVLLCGCMHREVHTDLEELSKH